MRTGGGSSGTWGLPLYVGHSEKSVSRSSTDHLLLEIPKSDRGGLSSEALDLHGDESLDVLPGRVTEICRHPVVYEEQAKPSHGVGVALDRFRRFVGGSERQLKAADEQRNVRGTPDTLQIQKSARRGFRCLCLPLHL